MNTNPTPHPIPNATTTSIALQKSTSVLAATPVSTDQALALFDSLPVVSVDSMWGRWRGEGFATHHALDGMLEAGRWYGKQFVDADHVHPLLFGNPQDGLFSANPALIPLTLLRSPPPLMKKPLAGRIIFYGVKGLLQTPHSQARLRMTEYRGKTSATMIYDRLPIHDVFRQIDHNTLLGLMDLKGMAKPFFFVLHRD